MATYRDIDSNARIGGDLVVVGSLSPLGGIVGLDLTDYAKLAASNTFTANGAIRIRATTNSTTQYTDESVTFSTDSKTLAQKPIDAMSEAVRSAAGGGGTLYVRDTDYTINYRSGTISRVSEGSIAASATVYVTYTKTVDVISLVSNDESTTYFAVDSRGNIFGKSITVNLSSSSSSSNSSSEGDFTINGGNLTVNGSSNLGNTSANVTTVMGTFKLKTADGTSDAIVLSNTGQITINGTRKDNLWDTAYTHSQITTGNPHGTTKTDLGLGSVENKSSATIRGEITSANVTTALTYTPLKNTTDTMSGALTVGAGGGALSLKPGSADYVYMQFYADSQATTTRSGYIGYGSAGTTVLTIANEMANANMNLATNGTGKVTVNSNEIWHAGNFTPANFNMGTGTFTGTVNFPGSGIWKSDGTVGIGYTSPSYKLDVNGDIRATGRLIAKVPDANTAPIYIEAPAGVTMTPMVSKLNTEYLSGYKAGDIFNSAIRVFGYGVVQGCEISAATADLRCNITAGLVYIKDYGYLSISAQEFGGFTVGDYHTVFISGVTSLPNYTLGGIAVVKSSTGWPDMSAYAYLNPIILAKVRPTISVVSDGDIYLCRQYIALQYAQSLNKIKIFDSDKEDQIRSSGLVVTTRIEMNKNGSRTNMKISDLPDASNLVKKVTFETDKMTFDDGTGVLTTVTPTQITTWDDSGAKKHVHYYDAPLSVPTNAGKSFSVTSGHTLASDKTKVYKNGLRQKHGIDYTLSGSTCTFVTAPVTDDTIVIDYDL